MALNLIELVTKRLSPDLVGKMGSSVGESPGTVSRVASVGVPAILSGIVQRGSSESGARGILDTIRSGGYDTDETYAETDITRPSVAERGKGLLDGLFGGKLSGIVDGVSSHTGVSRAATGGLLGMLAPLVMGVLGKHARETNMSPAGLVSLLRGQSDSISRALPSSIASTLGTGAGAVHAREVAVVTPRGEMHKKKGPTWLWPLVALAAVGLGAFFLCSRERPEVSMPSAPTVTAPEAPPPAPAPPALPQPPEGIGGGPPSPVAPSLPTAPSQEEQAIAGQEGVRTTGNLDELERSLGESGEADLPRRFALDELTYAKSSASLTDEGEQSVKRIADLLKENPNAKVAIEGFTDDSGSPETNRVLSRARADSVKRELVGFGVGADRIETAGYGPDRPIAPNDSEENRVKNRRTELVLTDK